MEKRWGGAELGAQGWGRLEALQQHITIRTCTWAGWDGCWCQLPFGSTRCCHNVNSGQEKAPTICCKVQSSPGLGRLPCSDTAGLRYLYLHAVHTPDTSREKGVGLNASSHELWLLRSHPEMNQSVPGIPAHHIASVCKLKGYRYSLTCNNGADRFS